MARIKVSRLSHRGRLTNFYKVVKLYSGERRYYWKTMKTPILSYKKALAYARELRGKKP